MQETILRLENVKKYFPASSGLFRKPEWIKAVDGISLEVARGKIFAVVGETGSGKTTLGRTVVRLYEPTEGRIDFDGQDISKTRGAELTKVHTKLQMVFQDPMSSLNPRRRVQQILMDPLQIHKIGNGRERLRRVRELLELVQLSDDYLHRFPHNLSGGERQRVNLARALALGPELVVLDEPTSALDVSVQAKVVSLLMDLRRKLNLTFLFITHNLILVKNIADMVAVLYHGKVMEMGPTEEIFDYPAHPYTQTLLSSIALVEESAHLPDGRERPGQTESGINLIHPPVGCRFYARCSIREERCKDVYPDLREIRKGHFVSCHLA